MWYYFEQGWEKFGKNILKRESYFHLWGFSHIIFFHSFNIFMISKWLINYFYCGYDVFNFEFFGNNFWQQLHIQPAITCLKLKIESLKQGAKYVQS